jgi:hypothetical protein
MVKTTKELRQIILDNGMTIEETAYRGRYRVVSKDGSIWNTVRFSNATTFEDARVKVLYYDFEGRESWTAMSIEGFIEKMTL